MHESSQSWSQSEIDPEKPVWTSGRSNYAYFSVNFDNLNTPRRGPYFVTKAYGYDENWEEGTELPDSLTTLENSTTQNSIIGEDSMSQLEGEAGNASEELQDSNVTTSHILDKYDIADFHENSNSYSCGSGSQEGSVYDEISVRSVSPGILEMISASSKLQSKIRKITKDNQQLINRCTQVGACVGDDSFPVVTYEDKAIQVNLLLPEQMIAERPSVEIQTAPEEIVQELNVKSSASNSRRLHKKERIVQKAQTGSSSVPEKCTCSCKRVKRTVAVADSCSASEQCVVDERFDVEATETEEPRNQEQGVSDRNHGHNIVPSNTRKKLGKSVEISNGLSTDKEPSDHVVGVGLNVVSNTLVSTWGSSTNKTGGTKKQNQTAQSPTVHGKDSPPLSPIEDVEFRKTRSFSIAVKKRSHIRNEFCESDRMAIVRFLLEEANGSCTTGGNKIWKHMAMCKVCPGHTWQSIKEHYRKRIVPALSQHGETRTGFKKYLESL